MSVVINTNSAATSAAYNLSNTNVNLQRSLNRLSSGSRINSSFDDAGGLAVSMKMSAAIRRTDATAANVGNSISYLQTQDGVLKNADKILSRMSELSTLSLDVTKTNDDRALYNREFGVLYSQLNALETEEFNGISLFSVQSGGLTLGEAMHTVYTSEDGATQTVGISRANLGFVNDVTITTGGISNLADAQTATGRIQTAIENVAQLRAQNGAEQSRLSYSLDMLKINKGNLEAANSRIIDVDVAAESTQLARFNILQQAGTAMLAQANQATQSILRLIS
jgi:flagellin